MHRLGNEQAWWQTAGIDPLGVAQKLWNTTRVNEGRLEPQAQPSSAVASPPADQAAKPRKKGSKAAPPKPPDGNRTAPV